MLATKISVGLSVKAWEATSIGDRFNDYFVFDEDESILFMRQGACRRSAPTA
jgi:hypothetical protein